MQWCSRSNFCQKGSLLMDSWDCWMNHYQITGLEKKGILKRTKSCSFNRLASCLLSSFDKKYKRYKRKGIDLTHRLVLYTADGLHWFTIDITDYGENVPWGQNDKGGWKRLFVWLGNFQIVRCNNTFPLLYHKIFEQHLKATTLYTRGLLAPSD